jgi:hypothetical protein
MATFLPHTVRMTTGPNGFRRNRPGYSARKIADGHYFQRATSALFLLAVCLVVLNVLPHLVGKESPNKKTPGKEISSVVNSGLKPIAILLGLVFAVKLVGSIVVSNARTYRKQERKAVRGAVAEEAIGHLLEQLPEPRAIFHDVGTGRGDIDHILLSPAHGVILIETKSHHGTVEVQNGALLINGRPPEKDFIAQTIRNTMWLRQRLKETTGLDVWIQPIIVFTNAFVREWKPVRNILLRNKKYLLKAIGETRAHPDIAAKLWALHQQGRPLW